MNGLMETGEAIREYSFTKVVQAALEHSHSGVGVVDAYAVIDWGFDQIDFSGGRRLRPSGAILRQAHRRAEGQYSLLKHDRTTQIERILRQYGITSAGAHRDTYGRELMNVQGTFDESHILDFGAFRTVKRFELEVVPFYKTSFVVMDPREINFPQPLKEYRLPFQIWGSSNTDVLFPQKEERVWLKSRELADVFRNDRASAALKIDEFRKVFIEDWIEHLRTNPFNGTVEEWIQISTCRNALAPVAESAKAP